MVYSNIRHIVSAKLECGQTIGNINNIDIDILEFILYGIPQIQLNAHEMYDVSVLIQRAFKT